MATSHLILSVIADYAVLTIVKRRKIKSQRIWSIKTSCRILQKSFIYLIFITGYLHPHFIKISQGQPHFAVFDRHKHRLRMQDIQHSFKSGKVSHQQSVNSATIRLPFALILLESLLQTHEILRCAFTLLLIEFHFQQSIFRKQREGLAIILPGQRFKFLPPVRLRGHLRHIEILCNTCLDRRILQFFCQHGIYILIHTTTPITIAASVEHIPQDVFIIITCQRHDSRIKDSPARLIYILTASFHKPVLHFRHRLQKFLRTGSFPIHQINQQRIIICQDLVSHLLLQSISLLPVTE